MGSVATSRWLDADGGQQEGMYQWQLNDRSVGDAVRWGVGCQSIMDEEDRDLFGLGKADLVTKDVYQEQESTFSATVS